ncbi:hypothetical protein AB0387_05315 [Streptomyces sp. NPDC089173]|uniref:hypothetical protein n=1 Tax=Streptomyces sp. NPDC089173 TaxID=3154965 RepID=UPI00344EB950
MFTELEKDLLHGLAAVWSVRQRAGIKLQRLLDSVDQSGKCGAFVDLDAEFVESSLRGRLDELLGCANGTVGDLW